MAFEESRRVVDDGLPSQVWAWLDPHTAINDQEQLVSSVADEAGAIADWLPMVFAAGFVLADAAATLMGRGDLVNFINRLAGH
jgi:hypothetical protein